jgi:hypothetical protein
MDLNCYRSVGLRVETGNGLPDGGGFRFCPKKGSRRPAGRRLPTTGLDKRLGWAQEPRKIPRNFSAREKRKNCEAFGSPVYCTLRLVVPVNPPSEALIVVVPVDIPLAKPVVVIVATLTTLELQVEEVVISPFEPSE